MVNVGKIYHTLTLWDSGFRGPLGFSWNFECPADSGCGRHDGKPVRLAWKFLQSGQKSQIFREDSGLLHLLRILLWNLNTLRFVSVMKNTPTPSSSDVRWAREILGPTWISTYPGLYQNQWLQAFWAPVFYGSKSSFEVFSGRNCVKKSMSFYWNYCKQGKALHIGASLHFFVQFIQDTPETVILRVYEETLSLVSRWHW